MRCCAKVLASECQYLHESPHGFTECDLLDRYDRCFTVFQICFCDSFMLRKSNHWPKTGHMQEEKRHSCPRASQAIPACLYRSTRETISPPQDLWMVWIWGLKVAAFMRLTQALQSSR